MVAGVAEGCVQAGAALIGGETVEMPAPYGEDDYDLAGFCGRWLKNLKSLTVQKWQRRCSFGLASSGIHSNGYSLSSVVSLRDYR